MGYGRLAVVGFVCGAVAAVALADGPVAFVSGDSEIVRVDAGGLTKIFSAKSGFTPEALAMDGSGRLFACDPSRSQIHLLQKATSGNWTLKTIYDKSKAKAPSPEQPTGCSIVGPDLFFGERSGAKHGIWALRGAAVAPTSGPFGPPVLVATIPAVAGAVLTDLALTPNARLLVSQGNRVLVADPPAFNTFQALISGLPGQASAVAMNSVGEIFVALADLKRVDVFDGTGTACGVYVNTSPLRARDLAFDLGDNLVITAPKLTNGKGGNVLMAPPNGGPATHQCAFDPPTVAALPLGPVAPAAVSNVVLAPGSVSQEQLFADDQALTAKQCAALFQLDPEFLNELTCPVTVTCRLMPRAEFEARTDVFFMNTSCVDMPIASGNCVEIVVDGAECFGGTTEAKWTFFVLGNVAPEDRPGLLFAHDTGPTDAYTDNILTAFEAVVPDLPNDPGMTGKRDVFGSGLVGVIHAPNREPIADAGEDQLVDCEAATVTLDGSGSFDLDPIDAGTLTYFWTGPGIPEGAEDDASFAVDVSSLGPGVHVFELTVTDGGLYSDEGPLSGTDSVTIEIVCDE